jgi:malonate-semialdehyde dehydrogenase (acetylating)/methylmalonate-semialdehyde dehydrogenase
MQGYNLEDVARGIDETMIRQPLGVVAAITPFNFPSMIPLWFLPYALACGNSFVLKPSERVPLTMTRVFELLEQLHLPPGVVNLLNGSRAVVDALIDHPQVRAISFVGSTAVARHVYRRAASHGKRVQCQGGAKNHVVILPDADMPTTTQIVSDSAFGCAGQRCLAVSAVVTVGEAREPFTRSVAEMARSIKVGYGLDDGVQMGPVVTRESKYRIETAIGQGASEGAKVLLDGRSPSIPNYERGFFVAPTILDGVPPGSDISRTEIFGPVLGLTHVETVEEAIEVVASNPYGNAASIFTGSGAAARKFRYEVPVGNVGVNIGVAAPMAYFPFSGWKDSFLGVLHGQGRDAVEFYTEKKVVIERWPLEWSRKF